MSVRAMALVWELDLPKPLKFVLLALADHADHQGRNAYPGVELLSRKTGDHPRTVQRLLRELESRGLIEAVIPGGGVLAGGARGRATVYTLHLEGKDDRTPPFASSTTSAAVIPNGGAEGRERWRGRPGTVAPMPPQPSNHQNHQQEGDDGGQLDPSPDLAKLSVPWHLTETP